jgi:ribokinase
MSERPRVTVLASLNVDLTVTAPRLPEKGETLLGTSVSSSRGGKGGNQAVALARLAVPTAVIGCVGDDEAGRSYLDGLNAEGLDTRHVRVVPGAPTGTALITVDDAGANTIVVVPGANAQITPGDVTAAEPTIAESNVVLAQLETPVAPTTDAFRFARAHGVITVLNPAPASHDLDALLELTDILVPNELEFAALVGGDAAGSPDEMGRSCAPLFERGIAWVIVTRGEHGAVAIEPAGVHVVPALRVDAVDTTAAGDSFVAGLAEVVAREHSLCAETIVAGCRRGAAVAALSVQRRGAQASLPTAAEVERLEPGDHDGSDTVA